ncbi:MAG: hypothetical protein QM817_06020 [Archangium sp.]
MPGSPGTSEQGELPLIVRIRALHGGAALIFFAVLNIGVNLAMWLETRGPVRPLTHRLFALVPWPESIVGREFAIAQLLISAVVIFGAVHLRQFGSPSTARAGAVLAMLPLTSMWLLGLPLGLNAFFVLHEPLVRERFLRAPR